MKFEALLENGVIHIPEDIKGQLPQKTKVIISYDTPVDEKENEPEADTVEEEEDWIMTASYEDLVNTGDSLTVGEILQSPEVGSWSDMDIRDSAEYVAEMRRKRVWERKSKQV